MEKEQDSECNRIWTRWKLPGIGGIREWKFNVLGMQQEWQHSEMNILRTLVTKPLVFLVIKCCHSLAVLLALILLSILHFRGIPFRVSLFFLLLFFAIFADPSERIHFVQSSALRICNWQCQISRANFAAKQGLISM